MDATPTRRRSGRPLFRLMIALGLVALAAWWVFPDHSFERKSPVVYVFGPGRGLHQIDVVAVTFVVTAALLVLPYRSLGRPRRR